MPISPRQEENNDIGLGRVTLADLSRPQPFGRVNLHPQHIVVQFLKDIGDRNPVDTQIPLGG